MHNLAVFICNRIENLLVQSIENILKIIIENSGTLQNKEKITNDKYSLMVDKLQLDEEGQGEFDAILKSYQDELSDLVYYGDDSLIAVDPKIGMLRNSINWASIFFASWLTEVSINLPYLF
jgi:hypothetical protein